MRCILSAVRRSSWVLGGLFLVLVGAAIWLLLSIRKKTVVAETVIHRLEDAPAPTQASIPPPAAQAASPKQPPAPANALSALAPTVDPLEPIAASGRVPGKPIPPKDPNGPDHDWRNFNEKERVAVAALERETADFGSVTEMLEAGQGIEKVRGRPVTEDEQKRMHEALTDMAAVYERGYTGYSNRTGSVIDFADAMRGARSDFDKKIIGIYGLSQEQFEQLFPQRRR